MHFSQKFRVSQLFRLESTVIMPQPSWCDERCKGVGECNVLSSSDLSWIVPLTCDLHLWCVFNAPCSLSYSLTAAFSVIFVELWPLWTMVMVLFLIFLILFICFSLGKMEELGEASVGNNCFSQLRWGFRIELWERPFVWKVSMLMDKAVASLTIAALSFYLSELWGGFLKFLLHIHKIFSPSVAN